MSFINNLYDLLNNGEEGVRWSHDGSSFHVTNPTVFSSDVLPRYFKHNKYTSFIRQMNVYGTSLCEDCVLIAWSTLERYVSKWSRRVIQLIETPDPILAVWAHALASLFDDCNGDGVLRKSHVNENCVCARAHVHSMLLSLKPV